MCSLKPHVSINTLKIIKYSYFHSVMTYGLLFWRHSSESIKIFRLKKKIIRSCWVLEVVTLVKNCFLIYKSYHSLPSTFFLFLLFVCLYLLFHKSIIVYRHTGCGTCQDSRYNIVKYKYYTLHITKDT